MVRMLVSSIAASAVLAAAASFAAAAAADAPPTAQQILFDAKHIIGVPAGTELVYKFERKPSDAQLLGPGYTDEIKVKVESDAPEGKKNVIVTMFSGERGRDPNKITDMDGNPMLVVYLDTALGHFQQLAGGDRTYLKSRFSKSFVSDAKVEPVKISYKGTDVDGYRVTVTPFVNDASRARMRGFEVSTFSIVVGDKIPGQFGQMISKYNNSDKTAPTLEETMTLDGVQEVK